MAGIAQLPPPPRQVRRRAGWLGTNNNGCLMVFALPFILAGAGMLIAVLLRLLVQSYGTPVMVIVDGGLVSRTSHANNKRTYTINFHYLLNGQPHNDHQQVTAAEYDRMTKNSHASGKVMQIGSWYVCISTVGNPNTNTEMMAVVGIIFNVIMVLFVVSNWGPAIRQRRLVRDGTAAAGTLVEHIIIRAGKSKNDAISFVFKTPDGSEMINKISVSQKAFQSAKVGEPVTVLYDPLKPQRSVAYEYCDFEVVPMVG